jgi:hypothetical protein
MKNIARQLEHSVEAEASLSFAWNWRTDIKTWDDPPARFQLAWLDLRVLRGHRLRAVRGSCTGCRDEHAAH